MDATSDTDETRKFLDQLLLISSQEDDEPYCILSGSGYDSFWSPQTKQMMMAMRGTEIIFLSDYAESKCLVMSHGNILVVDNDEIIEVGYN
jgi:hypothetical protein